MDVIYINVNGDGNVRKKASFQNRHRCTRSRGVKYFENCVRDFLIFSILLVIFFVIIFVIFFFDFFRRKEIFMRFFRVLYPSSFLVAISFVEPKHQSKVNDA